MTHARPGRALTHARHTVSLPARGLWPLAVSQGRGTMGREKENDVVVYVTVTTRLQ